MRKNSFIALVAASVLLVGIGVVLAQTSANTSATRPTQGTNPVTGMDGNASGSQTGGILLRPDRLWYHFASGSTDAYAATPAVLTGATTVTGQLALTLPIGTTVDSSWADLGTTPTLNAMWANSHIDQSTPGQITLVVTKPTSSTLITPIASSTATYVSWGASVH